MVWGALVPCLAMAITVGASAAVLYVTLGFVVAAVAVQPTQNVSPHPRPQPTCLARCRFVSLKAMWPY